VNVTPIDGGRGQVLAADTAKHLRQLADDFEAGRATKLVAVAIVDGALQFHSTASMLETVAFARIADDWAMSRMRAR
jgi:hypothetical protein